MDHLIKPHGGTLVNLSVNGDRAEEIRGAIAARIGDSLSGIEPGSEAAAEVKRVLISEGLWSQYLEVGIGPDAEVFTKSQPMSAVGWGADIGLHPKSAWNNPEPEIVLAVNSKGEIRGATLGNDVNLRDFEGRSALLLGKAVNHRMWTSQNPLRQFKGKLQLPPHILAQLEKKELPWERCVRPHLNSCQHVRAVPQKAVQ